MSLPKRTHYRIVWLCTHIAAFERARSFMDEIYPQSTPGPHLYCCARIGHHKLVVFLPQKVPPDKHGPLLRSPIQRLVQLFPKVKLFLAVGVGGGAPSQQNDIRLGDVVVGLAKDTNKSMFTYDIDKTLVSRRFESVQVFDLPYSISAARLPDRIVGKPLPLPPHSTDHLYKSEVVHQNTSQPCSTMCENDKSQMVQRSARDGYGDAIRVHFGTIASSNKPMEDALVRDILATETNVLCFETEAYDILNEAPCLLIRGICNYSDSHKLGTGWEEYASASASFYANNLLRLLPRGILELQRAQKPNRFFRIGRCFITQWVEPLSAPPGDQASASTISDTDSDDDIFAEMRRYIVIRESYRSSWCVPIHTYEGRGTTKPDIKLCDHARIFKHGDDEPSSEFPLRKPIGIVIEGENELYRLHPSSLANFGKIYTIEHDVPIMNIGYVPKSQTNRLKLDLNALEISTLDMKYQRLRRDEGPVNIELRGKEKLEIQEVDVGDEGSVNIAISGESRATIKNLKGRDGSLSVRTTMRGILELGTVAINGQITIALSGESRVIVNTLQGYSGVFVATVKDAAKLVMRDVTLRGGSFAPALSHNSELVMRDVTLQGGSFAPALSHDSELVMGDVTLQGGSFAPALSGRSKLVIQILLGQDAYFMAKANMEARLEIVEAHFVDSIVNTNTNGESTSMIARLHNEGSSFTTKTGDKAIFDIGDSLVMNSPISMIVGGYSRVILNCSSTINKSLSRFISGVGTLNMVAEEHEGISETIIERKE
ncbi:purine and uridine phosphorylase [Xylaria grammica]|nr:purine and uridine phosphorylase [Xylaria grammica]